MNILKPYHLALFCMSRIHNIFIFLCMLHPQTCTREKHRVCLQPNLNKTYALHVSTRTHINGYLTQPDHLATLLTWLTQVDHVC